MNEESNNGLKIDAADLNEDMLHSILELISDGIWDWNANSGFVYRNPGWYRMLGYSPHALANTVFTWEKVIHPDDFPRVMAAFDAYIHQRAPRYQVEYRCLCKDGSYLWIEDRGEVLARNPDGSVARMFGAHRSIHDRKLLVEQLERRAQSLEAVVAQRTRELSEVNRQLQLQLDENRHLAERDTLTGVANRYRLETVLLHECERANRFRHPLSLILVDLDDFKLINDAHGHAQGDETLMRVADSIKGCVREVDLVARWGGDEFMVVLPESTLDAARVVAQKIRQAWRAAGHFKVSLSVGVVERADNETQAELVARCDRALYQSKAAGKDQVSG
ncbi:MAG: diguanylate cyclase [Pseudomonas sp.]|nr:diguanylate cyclase [Pseudomonas sp.]